MDKLKPDFITPMESCPWCGTIEGLFQQRSLPARKSFVYRYIHDIATCPVYICTKWHDKKSECIDDWNNRMVKND